MQSILEKLFYQYDSARVEDPAILQRIATNAGMLKKDFNKWQKVRLLNIVDDKDFLAVERANDSFASGVRYGVQFMVEVFKESHINIDN